MATIKLTLSDTQLIILKDAIETAQEDYDEDGLIANLSREDYDNQITDILNQIINTHESTNSFKPTPNENP